MLMLQQAWHYADFWIALAIVGCCFTAAAPRIRVPIVGVQTAVLWVSLLGLLGGIALTLVRGLPVPYVHDEFAFLLQADTFAHGRLANPSHPHADSLETFHVLQHPTYAGKYPPAHAIFLAAGQILWHPIVGVWISCSLAFAAICWMLYAWLPPRWAFAGAALFALRMLTMFGVHQWCYSYWGGSTSALGGALVYGAGRRLLDRIDGKTVAIFCGGLMVLAHSRPLEGLVVSIPIVAVLGWRYLILRQAPMAALLTRLIGPALLVLVPGFTAMAYYNFRVTGDPLRHPYREHVAQKTQVQLFFWQSMQAPHSYVDSHVARFYHDEAHDWRAMQTWPGWQATNSFRLRWFSRWYFGWLLAPVVLLGACCRSRKIPLATIATLLVLGIGLQTCWFQPHYAAPAAPLLALFLGNGLRRMWHLSLFGKEIGKGAVLLIASSYCVLAIACLIPDWRSPPPTWSEKREAIIADLHKQPGKHLVIVHYSPDHNNTEEWVYNAANIDQSPIVFARSLGDGQDRELISYFGDRHLWTLQADESSPSLVKLTE